MSTISSTWWIVVWRLETKWFVSKSKTCTMALHHISPTQLITHQHKSHRIDRDHNSSHLMERNKIGWRLEDHLQTKRFSRNLQGEESHISTIRMSMMLTKTLSIILNPNSKLNMCRITKGGCKQWLSNSNSQFTSNSHHLFLFSNFNLQCTDSHPHNKDMLNLVLFIDRLYPNKHMCNLQCTSSSHKWCRLQCLPLASSQ